ncbi:MAG TPA: O-antigen ligase family protein, partial [Candidatus Xenobia bacterium]|jgi:tetratricopeptide (TPR) repeat protein
MLVAGLVGAAGWRVAGPRLVDRFHNAFTAHDEQAWSVRWMVLRGCLTTVSRSPWLGSGPGTFALVFQQDRPHGVFTGFVNQAHIEVVQVLVETGWVGLALFLGLTVAAVRAGWRAETPSALGPVAALLGLMVYGTVNFALPVPADLMWFFAVLGLAFAYQEAGRHRDPLDPVPGLHRVCLPHVCRLALPVLLMTSAKFLIDTGSHAVQAGRLAQRGDVAAQAHRWLPALEAYREAIALEPHNEQLYLQRAGVFESIGASLGRWPLVSSALDDVATALRLNPEGKNVRYSVALVWERWGKERDAEHLLEAETRAYPEDWRVWSELASLAAGQNHAREAAEFLWRACRDASGGDMVNPLAHLLAGMETVSPGEAGRLLVKWARTWPDSASVAADVALQVGEYAVTLPPETASAMARVALLVDPRHPEACKSLAVYELRAGHEREAFAAVLTWCRQSGQSLGTAVPAVIDQASLDRTHVDAGIRLLEASLGLRPNDNNLRLLLVRLYGVKQDARNACRIYRDAIRVDPDNPRLYEGLGTLELQQGNSREAHSLFLDAARLDPSNTSYQNTLLQFEKSHPTAPGEVRGTP